MNISAFDVYLVMQLDTINGVLVAASILSGVSAMVLLPFALTAHFDARLLGDDASAAALKASKRYLRAALVALGAFLAVLAVMPSSKTAAAMILLPALASDEVMEPVSREAAELYGLAKQALKNAAGEKE